MKPSTLLFTTAVTALLTVSTTAWPWPFLYPPHLPFFPPHLPIFPSRPFFPSPPGGDSAPPPPSSGTSSVNSDSGSASESGSESSSPTAADVKKCLKAVHDSGFKSCLRHKYDAEKCCTYVTGLEDSCAYVPFYKSHFFHAKLMQVCDAVSATP